MLGIMALNTVKLENPEHLNYFWTVIMSGKKTNQIQEICGLH